jgi:hypothetical protein
MFTGEVGDAAQTGSDGIVTNGRRSLAGGNPVLSDHVGDGDVGCDRDELHLAESEGLRQIAAVPRAVLLFRFRPSPRYCDHKPAAPAAHVVADMDDDFVTIGLRLGGVSEGVGDFTGASTLDGREWPREQRRQKDGEELANRSKPGMAAGSHVIQRG